jgi:hypothetical protein
MAGLIYIWRNEQKCAMVTHGHSLLQKCGYDLLSMDDFFEAIDRANAHFWRSFSIISDRIRGLGHGSDYVANIIDGAAKFGQSSIVPLSGYNFFIKTVKLPIADFGISALKSLSIISPITTSIVAPNPIRIAQFSYNFLTDMITQLIPLAIKIDRNPNDVASSRELINLFSTHILELGGPNGKFFNSVTLGMLDGCSSISLMIGYRNPWGTFFRKQCEVTPTAIQSLVEFSLAILVNVPFAKCVCVDARNTGAVFSTYIIENCYYFAPSNMRTMIFALVQAAEEDQSKIDTMCSILVEYAATSVKDSMIPVFSKQFDATQYIGSSVDYLMNVIESDGGRCMDFSQNPYAIVLMPEPVDYFAACGSTTLCATKCSSEMNAFEKEVARYADASKVSIVTFF